MKFIFTCLLFLTAYCGAAQSISTDTIIITGNCWGKPKIDTTLNSLQKSMAGKVNNPNIAHKNSGWHEKGRVVLRCGAGSMNPINPLFEVDGRITPPSLVNEIRPTDIFWISVVKGDSAIALYGAAAEGGVVRIYTKANWLLVLDGVSLDIDSLQRIPVSDILSADTVWANKFTSVIGCRRPRNVLLITTHASQKKVMTVRDWQGGDLLPGATVSIFSKDKPDTAFLVADDKGAVVLPLLQQYTAYSMQVSSVGYKSYSMNFIPGRDKIPGSVMLERDIKNCKPVTLTSIVCYRKITCGGMVKITRDKTLAETKGVFTNSLHFYPNPVQKGGRLTFEWNGLSANPAEYRLFSLGGMLMTRQPVSLKTASGTIQVPIDSRWSAGTYFLQVVCENGSVLASEKIILQ